MKHLIILAIVAAASSVTGCKKCYQCMVYDENDKYVYGYLENCLSKKDYEKYKSICESALKTGEKCVCSELE